MGWRYTLPELAGIIEAGRPSVNTPFTAVSTDTRTLEPGDVFIALTGNRFDGNEFVAEAFRKGACAAVTTKPNASGPCLIVPDTLRALQAFAARHRNRYRIPVIAITGSCGKTSTKDMAAAVLATKYTVVKTRGNLNNEIGCPLSLLQIDDETDLAIIEMGANHPGEIARLCELARPTEGAIIMVAPAHLEGFGTIENVAKAKAELVDALPRDGIFYANADDEWCVRIADSFPGTTVRFGRSGDIMLNSLSYDSAGQMCVDIDRVGKLKLPLYCPAHVTNVLLAVAIGLHHRVTAFEQPLREACAALDRFRLTHVGPLEVIDDTYNANPSSMAAALDALAARPGSGARIAALGEMLELGDAAADLHREVGARAGGAGVRCLFARGPHACDTIAGAIAAKVPHAEEIEDHDAMARAIREIARPGDVLLVKGSRATQMERVIEELRRLYS
ncbi:MAG TPA: UDP-N-acetylmuramoyl-tripeptide--D-alanyl-D-alanine ligase [Candidatus Hydrogenedentes bacterium]|nr:UDP-N-acetylmuramoyl-tripeptide--D-alanyl-D-alanine ligase [Candidatus Hydrogenedentota bacterium]